MAPAVDGSDASSRSELAEGATRKTCPSCGRSFTCSGTSSCWCMGVRLSPEALRKLRATYADCLCEDCLMRLAQG